MFLLKLLALFLDCTVYMFRFAKQIPQIECTKLKTRNDQQDRFLKKFFTWKYKPYDFNSILYFAVDWKIPAVVSSIKPAEKTKKKPGRSIITCTMASHDRGFDTLHVLS